MCVCVCVCSELKTTELLYCDSSIIQVPNRVTNCRQNWGNYYRYTFMTNR